MSESPNASAKGKGKGKEIVEQIEVAGDQLVSTVKRLISDGSTRRIVLRSEDGKELFSLPMNVGVAGAGIMTLASPLLAAIGAVAALVSKVHIDVVREGEKSEPAPGAGEGPQDTV